MGYLFDGCGVSPSKAVAFQKMVSSRRVEFDEALFVNAKGAESRATSKKLDALEKELAELKEAIWHRWGGRNSVKK